MNEAAQRLEQVFARVARERMADMPLCNPALRVKAFGFAPGEGFAVGVLVTPWAMNLVLLPSDAAWEALPPGSKQRHRFPSGTYEFVVGDEPELGRYQSCSLFSPMFEFADQASAEAAAGAALEALFDEAHRAGGTPDDAGPTAHGSGPRADHPISRRELLRGALFRQGGERDAGKT